VPLLVRGLPGGAPPWQAYRVRITLCRAMPASQAAEPQHARYLDPAVSPCGRADQSVGDA